MNTILHIDSSVRPFREQGKKHGSISRMLGQHFMTHWQKHHPQHQVIYRDIGTNPPNFISQEWIESVFIKHASRSAEQNMLLTESDQLIHEIHKADLILMTTPMYNYGMPAALKAWFDQVIRINKTFSFDLSRGDYPLTPIFSNKTLVLLSSCGEFGFGEGEIRAHMNHLGTHIQVLSKYLGVDNFYEIRSEYQEFADERHQNSLLLAKNAIEALVKAL